MEFPSFSRWGQLGLFLSSLNTTGLSHSKACASHTTVAQQAQPVGCAGIVAATINSNPQECNLIQALNGAKDFHIELRRKKLVKNMKVCLSGLVCPGYERAPVLHKAEKEVHIRHIIGGPTCFFTEAETPSHHGRKY